MTNESEQASLSFSYLGDQWLIAYASTNIVPSPVTLFLVGHCLESYCKSAILKINPDCEVVRFGHNIEKMINKLRTEAGLLEEIVFLPDVERRFMTGGLIPISETSDPAYIHYIQNQELYWTAKFQKELKYLGTQGKHMPTQYGVFVVNRNPFWIPILLELRSFIRKDLNYESPFIAMYRANSDPETPDRIFVDSICSMGQS